MMNANFRFAKRIENLTPTMILEISAQAARDPEIINLSVGQPDFPTPEPIKDAGTKAIRNNFTRYTAGSGIAELRQAVADRVSRETGIPRTAGNVVISNGAKHALSSAILALVDTGDRVLLPAPFYPSYPDMVHLAQGEVIFLPTEAESGFRVTPAQLEAALATDPKLLILNSPSNPTGAAYSRENLDLLVPLIKESGIMVLSDEIYDKIVYDGRNHASLASYPEIQDQVILINGVSKTYSMTGWRIGWLVGNENVAQKVGMVQSQMTSSPCSISQKAALEALSRPEEELKPMQTAFQQRRDRGVSLLAEIPEVKCHPPEGAFYLFPDVSAYLPPLEPGTSSHLRVLTDCPGHAGDSPQRSLELAQYLIKEHKVAVAPGMIFGADDHIRISFAASFEEIEEGIRRVGRGLMEYRECAARDKLKE